MVGQFPARRLGALDNAALGNSALAVGPIELGRDRGGSCLVGGEHQLHRRIGAVQAPGGVDARP
jgi:hypothetical protein